MVVRPNADTLYTALTYDVSKEPLVVSIPDSGGRYYLLPWLDYWTDVFTVPGKRATGTKAQTIAIAGPNWQGELSDGVRLYRSPTNSGLLIGRTQTNGKADYEEVNKFQDGMKAYPLSAYGKPYTPPKGKVNSDQDMSAPPEQVEKMEAATFFAMLAELMKDNPPHANDYPVIDRMRWIGIEPGKGFVFASAPQEVQDALKEAPTRAMPQIKAAWSNAGVFANGWRTNVTAIGTYGTDYLRRAGVAYGGLGANVPQDAIYPTAFADSEGRPFSSDKRYTIHFAKDQIPPARVLVADDVRRAPTLHPQPDRALRDRRPGQAGVQSGRVSRPLHTAGVPRPRQRVKLATGAEERFVHDEYAALLAEGERARRHMGSPSCEAGRQRGDNASAVIRMPSAAACRA